MNSNKISQKIGIQNNLNYGVNLAYSKKAELIKILATLILCEVNRKENELIKIRFNLVIKRIQLS